LGKERRGEINSILMKSIFEQCSLQAAVNYSQMQKKKKKIAFEMHKSKSNVADFLVFCLFILDKSKK
jgi:hypothetical protein